MLARRVRTDGFVDPCIPSRALKPPAGPDWVHEVKHDGYRLIVRWNGATVRLFTRRGYDWTDRYPAIANAAGKLKARSFTLDGEAVVCGADGCRAVRRPPPARPYPRRHPAGLRPAGTLRGWANDPAALPATLDGGRASGVGCSGGQRAR
jgi:hypothetical protein